MIWDIYSRLSSVRAVWLPERQAPLVQLGSEGQAPQDDWYWTHELPQVCLAPLQERLPVCPISSCHAIMLTLYISENTSAPARKKHAAADA